MEKKWNKLTKKRKEKPKTKVWYGKVMLVTYLPDRLLYSFEEGNIIYVNHISFIMPNEH